jgi:PAS domain S-box-containing protein
MTTDSRDDSGGAPASPVSKLEPQTLLDSVPDGILITDGEGRICEVNVQLETLFRYSRQELLGQPVEMLVPTELRQDHKAHRDGYDANPSARPMGTGEELQGLRSDGTLFPAEISLSPMTTDQGAFVIATVRDVSERRRLRDFGVAALRASEEERLRLAQELHDDTAQQLSALLLRLRVARNEMDSQAREDQFDQLREAIQSCAESVRRIARGLRPPALQDVGVVAAIRSHVRSLADPAELRYAVDADAVENLLDDDAKLVLYRVVQEAVSNSVRHAKAASLRVSISVAEGQINATIEDDGIGFDSSVPPSSGGGLGLTGMEERIRSLGGHLEFRGAPGVGTVVVIQIPESKERTAHG